jgi:hypothetical protein
MVAVVFALIALLTMSSELFAFYESNKPPSSCKEVVSTMTTWVIAQERSNPAA